MSYNMNHNLNECELFVKYKSSYVSSLSNFIILSLLYWAKESIFTINVNHIFYYKYIKLMYVCGR